MSKRKLILKDICHVSNWLTQQRSVEWNSIVLWPFISVSRIFIAMKIQPRSCAL